MNSPAHNPSSTNLLPVASVADLVALKTPSATNPTESEKNTARRLERFEEFLGETATAKPADQVTAEDIDRWEQSLRKRHGHSTIRDHLKAVSGIFEFGIKNLHCSHNPVADWRKRADANPPASEGVGTTEVSSSALPVGQPDGGEAKMDVARLTDSIEESVQNQENQKVEPASEATAASATEESAGSKGEPPSAVPKAICDYCRKEGGCLYELPVKFPLPREGKCPVTKLCRNALYERLKAVKENGESAVILLYLGPSPEIDGRSYCEAARRRKAKKKKKKSITE